MIGMSAKGANVDLRAMDFTQINGKRTAFPFTANRVSAKLKSLQKRRRLATRNSIIFRRGIREQPNRISNSRARREGRGFACHRFTSPVIGDHMSTFAVFGVNPITIKATLHEESKVFVSFGQTYVSDKYVAEAINKAKPKRISDWFDAPQFAEEFADLAKRNGCTQLHIKCRIKIPTEIPGEFKTVTRQYSTKVDPRDDYERNDQQSERLGF